ncbi:MAG TPA: hypothetical protein VI248_13265 [Kineosporiaceae bacterium]
MATYKTAPTYEPLPDGRWLTVTATHNSASAGASSPFGEVDVSQAGVLAGFPLEELVDGRWWLKGSPLGAVHLHVSIDPPTIDHLGAEQLGVPMVESGPDRRYSLLDVDIFYPSSAYGGPETTPGTLTLEIRKVGLQVLEWLQERYQLPALPYHSVPCPDRARNREKTRHATSDAAEAPVVVPGPTGRWRTCWTRRDLDTWACSCPTGRTSSGTAAPASTLSATP